ncbi:CinA family protein [Pseudoroseomonas cervicalis]|uniref:Competence/damage-inducible domain protein CinA n=1 Tax=Pseudoroseomonas cervicalis ATCC 49957 TaxID=525371 RepID=D5RIY2_9PROT|nr:nicotinamide-nucleotide amidohydrolase family protein [Pseudoroseomonas cervicalis]EFH12738.1 competence/damage-inducible domain protein CinA [Pseudoroseomonas cervicalis ATCC 49957]
MSLLDETLLERAAALLAALRPRGLTVATAESCTGGLVSAALTAHAGSSATLLAGYVTYSNAAKTRMLGVPPPLLERHGAVSAEVARAMAEGALRDSGADLAVAITGIAGPGGATPGKPVGLVHLAAAGAGAPLQLYHEVFPGDRAAVRAASALRALAMLARQAGV